MENLIVAISNFTCALPLYTSYACGDMITLATVAFVSFASFISHLVENHKHAMPGIGFSTRTSYYLNRLDVAGVIMIVARVAYLYYSKYGLSFAMIKSCPSLFVSAFILAILLRISEHDKYNPALKTRYIVTHCVWHMGIFVTLNAFLRSIYN